jgi:hypothetical protein
MSREITIKWDYDDSCRPKLLDSVLEDAGIGDPKDGEPGQKAVTPTRSRALNLITEYPGDFDCADIGSFSHNFYEGYLAGFKESSLQIK